MTTAAAIDLEPGLFVDNKGRVNRIEVLERWTEPLWRLNNLYYCVTEQGEKVPFRLNWAQNKLFEEMWFWNLILKSRQHGFTTFIDILALDSALFNEHYSVGINAHTREDVEKIFDKKVKFPYRNLPLGLQKGIPADTDTAKMLKFPHGSSIEVGTSLRSGTYQFLHVSEFGKLCAKFPDKAQEVVTGTLETIHQGSINFIESTAEGNEGYFNDYCVEAIRLKESGVKLNKLQYKLHFFAWHDDPKNNLPPTGVLITKEQHEYFNKLYIEHGIKLNLAQMAWYAEKERKLMDKRSSALLMKREHPSIPEEAFMGSVEGSYLTTQMAILRKKGMIGFVPHVPNMPVNTGWDLGIGDEHYIWFHQRVGLQERLINVIHNSGEGLNWYVQEMQKHNYVFGNHFLPHDAGHRQLNALGGISIEEQLHDLGLRNLNVIPVTPTKEAAIEQSRGWLPTCWIDKENCDPGIKCLDGYKKQWDPALGCFKKKPHHNWASHGYDGFETLARGILLYGPGLLEEQKPSGGRRKPKDWRV
jgi:hypothetical protein